MEQYQRIFDAIRDAFPFVIPEETTINIVTDQKGIDIFNHDILKDINENPIVIKDVPKGGLGTGFSFTHLIMPPGFKLTVNTK